LWIVDGTRRVLPERVVLEEDLLDRTVALLAAHPSEGRDPTGAVDYPGTRVLVEIAKDLKVVVPRPIFSQFRAAWPLERTGRRVDLDRVREERRIAAIAVRPITGMSRNDEVSCVPEVEPSSR